MKFSLTTSRIYTNGHEYVDLGLPSGTIWAKCNVGANSETDYGLYFAWGETKGYTASQVPSEKKFGWEGDDNDYAFTQSNGIDWNDSTNYGMTKYNNTDGLTNLELTDDAAAVSMGGDWHMPTKAQCGELFNATYVRNEWVTNYQGSGVNGRLFTSVSNGNTLFIPAAGHCSNGKVFDVGDYGNVWPSSLYTVSVFSAWYFYFGSDGAGVGSSLRCFGLSVRGVVG